MIQVPESSLPEESQDLSRFDKDVISKLVVPVPHNEAERVRKLRQTGLLNTSYNEKSFDRLTAMAQRIYNVPIVLISLVDVDRQWFKSNIGLDASETHRDLAFCAYTILPDSPDVFVVQDALKDDRFRKNPLVTGHPFIRFYAGAALIVDGVKVGSLCIIDNKPHEDFDIKHRMNLLDLGETVSTLIRERRENLLSVEKERTQLVVDILHRVAEPLKDLSHSYSHLNAEQTLINSLLQTTPNANEKMTQFNRTLENIHRALTTLDVIVESGVRLGDSLISSSIKVASSPEETGLDEDTVTQSGPKPVTCNLLDTIENSTRKLKGLSLSGSPVMWNIEDSQFRKGWHQSYPDALSFVLLAAVGRAIALWKQINVMINFRVSFGDATLTVTDDRADDGIERLRGMVMIEIRASDNIPRLLTTDNYTYINGNNNNGTTTTTSTSNNNNSEETMTIHDIERILKDIGGGCWSVKFGGLADSLGSEERIYEFWLPCTIICDNHVTNLLPRIPSKDGVANSKSRSSSKIIDFPIRSASLGGGIGAGIITKQNSTESLLEDDINGPTCKLTTVRVLLVDDSLSFQKSLKKWFESHGCVVTVAGNGKIGLAYMKTKRFDIVMMDFLMPVMLGSEAIRQFFEWRKDPSTTTTLNSHSLIIGMSSDTPTHQQDEAFTYGMHFFTGKPIDLDCLSDIITVVENHRDLESRLQAIYDTAQIGAGIVTSSSEGGGGVRRSESAPGVPGNNNIPIIRENSADSVSTEWGGSGGKPGGGGKKWGLGFRGNRDAKVSPL